jgi:hypothetical protein
MTFAHDCASLTDSPVVRVSQAAPGVLRAVVDNPPINLFDPAVFAGLTYCAATSTCQRTR